jgi:hypothetical protein
MGDDGIAGKATGEIGTEGRSVLRPGFVVGNNELSSGTRPES